MTQICMQTDRKPGRRRVSGGHRGCCSAPVSTPCSRFRPLILCSGGFRLMKRVRTTKRNGSHLPDTPAHLWPSESSHHDRPPPHPPPPPFPSVLSPHVHPPSPGSTRVVWLPARCQTRLSHGGVKRRRGRSVAANRT